VSKVDIIQKGDSNQLEIDKEANSIKQKIVQVGQNNSIIDLQFTQTIIKYGAYPAG
jgi:hypothetical protein